MLHTTEEVDLPPLAGLGQDILGLVAELGGEDVVDLWGTLGHFDLGVCGKGEWGREPAAEMEKGFWIAASSESVMKEGCPL